MKNSLSQGFFLKPKAQMQRKFILTQYMKDALHILTLPLLELKSFIEEEIEKNPLLERVEPAQREKIFKEEKIGKIDFLESDPDQRNESPFSRDYENKKSFSAEKNQTSLIENIEGKTSAYDFLFFQISIAFKTKQDSLLAKKLIDYLNPSGILDSPVHEIAKDLHHPQKKIEELLGVIQTLDPPGIGAQDLAQCLLIQLKRGGKEDSPIYKIIKYHFRDLLNNKIGSIAKKMNMLVAKTQELIRNELKRLNFSPLKSFRSDHLQPITPDIIIKYEEKRWAITINDQNLPKFYIQKKYDIFFAELAQNDKEYIKKYIIQGKWLKKAIEERKRNLIKIVSSIVKKQKKFLLGEAPLCPITYKELSSLLKLHTSTISRAVAGKYVASPAGIIPLRSFFSSSLKSNKNAEASVDTALQILKKLIKEEDKKNPLSDEKLTKKIQEQGLFIARRTVAKYRQKLKIASASKRKSF